MRVLAVFGKSLREQLRAPWALAMVLLSAAFFVVADWAFLGGGGSTVYKVMVLNQDRGSRQSDGSNLKSGEAAVRALEEMQYASGQPILRVIAVADRQTAETKLKDREAAALVVIPEDFSRALEKQADQPSSLILVGDLTNPYYAVAAIMISSAIDGYVQAVTAEVRPVVFREEALGGSAARTEFEIYVPGILILSVILIVFQTAMVVAREVEAGTLRRLMLSRMTAFDLLAGITLTQVLIGVVSLLLTFSTAWALGFKSQGPLGVAILVAAVTSLSIVGVGLVIACFAKTVSEAFIYANFPLMVLMFFSGAMFPIPPVKLGTVAGHSFSLFDILPPTHAVAALNKVFTLGAGLSDIAFELGALLLLSALYFFLGVWLFNRTHLRPQ